MFLVMINYKKPIERVDQFVGLHREYLNQHYENNSFIVSGPRNPRIGGVMLSHLKNKEDLMKIIYNDPYFINDVADYEVIEFNPVKYHADFAKFL